MTRAKLPSPVPTEHSLIGECLLVYIWNAPDLIENIMEVFMNDFSVYGKDFEECPASFQWCTTAIFSDLIENIMEVFMDDFSFYGKHFEECPLNLDKVLKR
jgi:hypothetical protein